MNEQTQNDGGPAFPVPECENGDSGPYLPGNQGMSLRDYFAATIPLTQMDIDLLLTDPLNAFIAEAQIRYIKADAMLAMKARAAK